MFYLGLFGLRRFDYQSNRVILKDAKRNLWGAFRSGGARQTGSGSHRRGKKCVLFRLAAGGDMIGSGRCQ